MQKRRIVFGVFMVAIFGLVIWAGISTASIESKNFYDYFGVAYMPNASEQPQVRFAVLKGLLRLRSQCKELIKQRIKTEIAIEELRESIVNNPKQTDGVSGQRLIGLLKERAGFLEDEKERASLFFRACRLADSNNFADAYKAAECGVYKTAEDGAVLPIDVIALSNEVRETQTK